MNSGAFFLYIRNRLIPLKKRPPEYTGSLFNYAVISSRLYLMLFIVIVIVVVIIIVVVVIVIIVIIVVIIVVVVVIEITFEGFK